MKVGIIGIISNPVVSVNSHNGGWTYVSKMILEEWVGDKIDILSDKDDWNIYDLLIINEGVNYKEGSYNFFGGVNEKVVLRLYKLNEYNGQLLSINEKVNYVDMCKKRKELQTFTCNKTNIDVIELSSINKNLVLGDSHAVSAYKPGYSISRNDGKTLHGFLKTGLTNFINGHEKLIFYAGNIDVRFHIKRFGIESIFVLLNELERQLQTLPLKEISLVGLIPIENESRVIPNTDKYKGSNFLGSWQERMDYVLLFNDGLENICINNKFTYLPWSFNYLEELPFDKMESKQSVHLRPTSYMFISNLLNNE